MVRMNTFYFHSITIQASLEMRTCVMGRYIFVAYITTKDGQHIYARDYGLKALRIFVKF